MASKKRGRPKGSKNKKTSKRVAVTSTTKRRKKRVKRVVVAASPRTASLELGLLNKINHKVNRIDQTVNAGFHLARKAKHAQRRHAFSSALEEAEREGITAE